jgi:AraC-like DNA-binding protein
MRPNYRDTLNAIVLRHDITRGPPVLILSDPNGQTGWMMNPSMSGDRIPFRFSTDDVPEPDRIAIGREVLGRVHLRYDVEPLGDAPLRATFEQHPWTSVSLFFSQTSPISVERTPELIRDADDDFRLFWVDGARGQFVSNSVDEVINSGDAALLFNGVVGKVRFLGPCQISAIRIRRASLETAVRGLEDRAIRRAAPGSGPLRLLVDYTRLLRHQGPTSDPALAYRVANHLIDLVALALGPTEETRMRALGGATRAARLATIRADVIANLSQARLSARIIASRHGVSDRYVHRLFEETGQTFSQFVEEERLKRAFTLLNDPAVADGRIGDIAIHVGFAEHSTFNRAFRRRFGDTPTGIRRIRGG